MKGNVVYPEQLIDRYGLDATKYYLLREFPYNGDMTFTPENFINRYNSDLANDLGNLLNRTIGMINKYFEGKVNTDQAIRTNTDEELIKGVIKNAKETDEKLESIHYAEALESIWQIISLANKYIDDTKPWELFKSNKEQDTKCLISVMANLIETLHIVAILLQPFMAETANKIFEQLNIDEKNWDRAFEFNEKRGEVLVPNKPEPLFLRLDKNEEMNYLNELISLK